MGFKFYNGQPMNETKIVIFLRQFSGIRKKKRMLGGEKGKTKLRGKGDV